jgi:Domain of unknown function (DUF5666)
MRLTLIGSTLAIAALLAACSNSSLSSPSANQLAGPVQAITPPTLTVGGQIVTTSATTMVRRGGTRIDLNGLHLGEPVQVHGEQDGNDTLQANEIDADENEVEFHGIIDSIAAPKLWVNGRTIVTDSTTHILRGEDTRITLADLAVGDTVKVEGAVQADSSVLAHRIAVGSEDDDNDQGNEHEQEAGVALHGVIDSIAAPDLFVGGRTIVTDSTTTIERADSQVTLADLAAGDTVDVKGMVQADSSVLARYIEVGGEQQDHEERQADVRGVIDSLMAPTLFVGEHTVVTDSVTAFLRGDQRITFGDLQVGDTVDVEGVAQADSSILARKVEVRTGTGDGEP